MKLTLILLALMLSGCVSTPLTDDEREYNVQMDRENWYMCQMIYSQSGSSTYSTHSHSRYKKHTDRDVREDLVLNNCRFIMRDSYADKI